ncbi:hypothetical protein T12_6702 [Trichinella patagoniensis]|uniref:Uncharacterized protein n=1 Tax=Trichinella patagoniensis TaxID=990121 RepID=A0A0V0ZKT3_9BILA|nr:hypothetical protein T12_6702 [Trichinella patagoniensis]
MQKKRNVLYFTVVTDLANRLSVARREKEMKHCFNVVSRWKAVFNEATVEFILGELKVQCSLMRHSMQLNEMFPVTTGSVRSTVQI